MSNNADALNDLLSRYAPRRQGWWESFKDEIATTLDALPPHERSRLFEAIGATVGQYAHYRLMRRWGAPKYVAWSSAMITTTLAMIHREAKRLVDEAVSDD